MSGTEQGKGPQLRKRPKSGGDAGGSSSTEGSAAPAAPSKDKDSGLNSFLVRTVTTFMMIGGFVVIVYFGQTTCMLMVLGLQLGMFREVLRIGTHIRSERHIQGFRLLPWYFYSVVVAFLYLRTLRRPLIKTWPGLEDNFRHLSFVVFCLYVLGFMLFVCSLKAKFYAYQFGQLAWTHMGLLYIGVQGVCFVHNMFEGMLWFLLPTSLIIANDIFAYLCGKYFGRHRLIELSPKKTWEGFIGGAICTVLFGLYFSWQLTWWDRMICTKEDFMKPLDCDQSKMFLYNTYKLPVFVRNACNLLGLPWETVTLLPIQLHSLAFSAFASLVAPFGGFFASGLKRAFKIKDFGDVIPGHGGITDRMDCQGLMATFTAVYLKNFVLSQGGFCSSLSLLLHCTWRLPLKDQVKLFNELARRLVQAGVHIASNGTAALPIS